MAIVRKETERERLATLDSAISKTLRAIRSASVKGDRKALKAFNRELRALMDMRGTTENWTWKTQPEPDWEAMELVAHSMREASREAEARQRREREQAIIARIVDTETKMISRRAKKKAKAAAVKQALEVDHKPRRKINIAGIQEA